MPRVVRTLWFSDTGLMNEPVFDLPLAGKISMRQTAALLALLALAYLMSLSVADLTMKVMMGAAVFIPGALVFLQRVKTVPPEWYLALMLRGLLSAKKGRKRARHFGPPEVEKPGRRMAVAAVLGEPVKIVGCMRNPATGEPISDQPFDVFVEGEHYSSGISGSGGDFAVYFTPRRFGIFRLSLRPSGYAEDAESIEVQVEPEGGVRIG